MSTLVLTVIGDDRSGLVDALSAVVGRHGGNWGRSHMARLGGKFAGIVLVTVPSQSTPAFLIDLEPLEAQGLLDVTVEEADVDVDAPTGTRLEIELVGQDRPLIIHEMSSSLAELGVSLEELTTATRSAPMAGGVLFEAEAVLRLPGNVSADDVARCLEGLGPEFMVDIAMSITG